ncbi:MAG: Mut7-C RNAse domain-containing protein [Verrucomicrobiia bacterium]
MNKIGKIEKVFENWFLDSLKLLNARRIDKALQLIWNSVENKSFDQIGIDTRALLDQHFKLRNSVKVIQKVRQTGEDSHHSVNSFENLKFVCDAGLGGLSRWLRVTGYEAIWVDAVNDDELISIAINQDAPSILLTTDTMLFERRILKDGTIRALWLPPTIKPIEQLRIVFDFLSLKILEPRCMKCGGELRGVDKERVIDRIPPKTLKWINEYYLCSRCNTLFWKGTHWKRITPVIQQLNVSD